MGCLLATNLNDKGLAIDIWTKILLWITPVIFAVTLHEVAHGWAARFFGDDTAQQQGRLSLNPLRHIDPVGSILVPSILLTLSGFIFGWAKPVPVIAQRLNHPKRDMGLVALAGPAANFFMSLFWALMLKIGLALIMVSPTFASILIYSGVAGVVINTALMMLNLLPIPPLDGGRILASLLPSNKAVLLFKLERYGLAIMVILLLSGVLSKILWPMMSFGIAIVTHLLDIPTAVFMRSLAVLLN